MILTNLFRLLSPLVVLLLACATPAPPPAPPTAPPTTAPRPATFSPCEMIMLAYCARGAACGAWSEVACLAATIPSCSEVFGITAHEATRCSEAVAALPCSSDRLPQECFGVGYSHPRPDEGLSL